MKTASLDKKRFANEMAKQIVSSWLRSVPVLNKPCQGLLDNLRAQVEFSILAAIEKYGAEERAMG